MIRPFRLSARWSTAKKHQGAGSALYNEGVAGDLVYEWGDGIPKSDSHLLHLFLGVERPDGTGGWSPSLIQELHARGYDVTTLTVSVMKRQP